MNRTIFLAGVLIVLAGCAFGQTPTFDVVSIKPNKSESGNSSSNTHFGIFTGTNVSLKSLIMRAYGLAAYQISGPEWLSSEKFDISAKPPAGAKEQDFPLMLRSMLLERFKLASHKDTKVFPVYGLVIAKGGPKFQPVADGENHSTNSSRGFFKCEQTSMAGVAIFLARQMDRPVVDMTELPGVYTLTLQFTPEDAAPQKEDSKSDKEVYPPLLTALQEQWGLKLEPKKAPLELLVVDHAEKVPTEN
ncbi:MAG TPA: TIGR03435 family protein [Candidatus Sulfopaludibacter sp.]|jgi:uncharacterized protein (TIGR03435 family)|nr:TIGR03435 family protein [Candidatus Sulfopaludibacter sp.]